MLENGRLASKHLQRKARMDAVLEMVLGELRKRSEVMNCSAPRFCRIGHDEGAASHHDARSHTHCQEGHPPLSPLPDQVLRFLLECSLTTSCTSSQESFQVRTNHVTRLLSITVLIQGAHGTSQDFQPPKTPARIYLLEFWEEVISVAWSGWSREEQHCIQPTWLAGPVWILYRESG